MRLECSLIYKVCEMNVTIIQVRNHVNLGSRLEN